MIDCPKCGADNMVGAIFCRTCGGKLNLDELTPDAFDEKEATAAKKLGKVAGRLATLAVLFVLVGLLVAMFLPVPLPVSGEVEPQALYRAMLQYQLLKVPRPQPRTFSFDSGQATAVAKRVLGLVSPNPAPTAEGAPPAAGAKSSGGTLAPADLSIELLGDNEIRLVLKSLLFGKVPVHNTLVVNCQVAEGGGATFSTVAGRIGKLAMPGPLLPLAIRPVESLIQEHGELLQIQNTIVALTIEESAAKITAKSR